MAAADGSFEATIAAVQTIIQGLSAYDSTNCSLGDFGVLDEGTEKCVVLGVGPTEHKGKQTKSSLREWVVVADMFVRSAGSTELEAQSDFVSTRDELIFHLEKYPSLDSLAGITKIRVSAPDMPLEVPAGRDVDAKQVQAFTHWWQELLITIDVRYSLSGGEYA